MSSIGITGASGFLGRNLVKNKKLKNVKLILFTGNLLNEVDVNTFFKENKIDQVIHLAGTFSPPFSNLIEKNLLLTEKLLDTGIKFGIKKIIFASTGAVYGEPLNLESFEDDPLKPMTPYALSKMYAEEYIQYCSQNKNLQYVLLRFPSIYGPDNNKGVIFNFIKGIKNDKKIIVHGDGNQGRDFLYVDDAVEAICKAIDYDKSNIFNVSSSLRLSINDIIKILRKRYDFEVEYKKADNNLKALYLNSAKIKKELGFVAKTKDLLIS